MKRRSFFIILVLVWTLDVSFRKEAVAQTLVNHQSSVWLKLCVDILNQINEALSLKIRMDP